MSEYEDNVKGKSLKEATIGFLLWLGAVAVGLFMVWNLFYGECGVWTPKDEEKTEYCNDQQAG